MISENPFTSRKAITRPSDFIGRTVEISRIQSLLHNTQSVSIVGPRKIGKSSLAYALANRGLKTEQFVVVDCGILHQKSQPGVYADLLEEIHLQVSSKTPAPADGSNYRAFEKKLRDVIGDDGLVLVLDEFERLALNPAVDVDFFSSLRALATRLPVAFVTITQNSLFDLTYAHSNTLSSPFFNIFATSRLGAFTAAEADELLFTLSERAGQPFPEPVRTTIQEFVGCHPLFLQMMGFQVFDALFLGEIDWNKVYQHTAPALSDHLTYNWSYLTPAHRDLLKRLPLQPHIDEAAMRTLEQNGWLQLTENGPRYASEIITRYVTEQNVDGWLQSGPVAVDTSRREVLAAGKPVILTPTRYDLLVYMLQNPGRVLETATVEKTLWPDEYTEDPERLKSVVKGLRKALGDHADYLETVRGVGYMWRLT